VSPIKNRDRTVRSAANKSSTALWPRGTGVQSDLYEGALTSGLGDRGAGEVGSANHYVGETGNEPMYLSQRENRLHLSKAILLKLRRESPRGFVEHAKIERLALGYPLLYLVILLRLVDDGQHQEVDYGLDPLASRFHNENRSIGALVAILWNIGPMMRGTAYKLHLPMNWCLNQRNLISPFLIKRIHIVVSVVATQCLGNSCSDWTEVIYS
jgi:hypothetical protein